MPSPWRNRLRRHLRPCGPCWAVGLALLAASQMLWRWQTWSVRTLLAAGGLP